MFDPKFFERKNYPLFYTIEKENWVRIYILSGNVYANISHYLSISLKCDFDLNINATRLDKIPRKDDRWIYISVIKE